MKLFHIVPDISAEANGVSPVVHGLGHHFSGGNNRFVISSLGMAEPPSGVEFWKCRKSANLQFIEYSSDFWRHLTTAGNEFDVVHNHSLWSACNLMSGWSSRPRAKLVVSPHGTLAPRALARRSLVKKILKPIQWRALNRADLIHATAESEMEDIRRLGFRAPIALIPNAVDVSDASALQGISSGPKDVRELLFVGRIHPIKGLDKLLDAWAQVQDKYTGWKLKIVGVGQEDYVSALKLRADKLRLQRVEWPGPLYGDDKITVYRNADLFILPSQSENFGMVVAEALAHGCPAIVSKGAPWEGLVSHDAGWWIDANVQELTRTLDAAMEMSELALKSMGLRGRAWISKEYSWEAISQKYLAAYQWVIGTEKRKPEFIFEVN